MTWPITDWTDADWSAVAAVNSLIGAARERESAIGWTPTIQFKSPGDDVQDAYVWRRLQNWVESRLRDYVISHDGGVKRSADYYNSRETIDTYLNRAALFAAAGLAHDDWRRYTVHPDDGGTPSYGEMYRGHIIGPWLFEDLQAALNAMIWTTPDVGWTPIDALCKSPNGESYMIGPYPTLAEARAATEAVWMDRPEYYRVEVSTNMYRDARGYFGSAIRASCYAQPREDIGTGINRAIDWHAHAWPREFGFHANGDPVYEDTWWCWLTDFPADAGPRPLSSQRLAGGTAFPAWAPEEEFDSYGYTASVRCLVRWDVDGGFVYQ